MWGIVFFFLCPRCSTLNGCLPPSDETPPSLFKLIFFPFSRMLKRLRTLFHCRRMMNSFFSPYSDESSFFFFRGVFFFFFSEHIVAARLLSPSPQFATSAPPSFKHRCRRNGLKGLHFFMSAVFFFFSFELTHQVFEKTLLF